MKCEMCLIIGFRRKLFVKNMRNQMNSIVIVSKLINSIKIERIVSILGPDLINRKI